MSSSYPPHTIWSWLHTCKTQMEKLEEQTWLPLKESYFGTILLTETQTRKTKKDQHILYQEKNKIILAKYTVLFPFLNLLTTKIYHFYFFLLLFLFESVTVLRLKVTRILRHNFMAIMYRSKKCNISVTLWTLKPLVQHC